ncbi:MAG: Ca2+-dependent phosphoinositide-specific phospholipase C [Candidatus Thermoplasmatota archaeon]|nr:Ca2+-dependent phosphoinositide-specific phospholipase C [Candidatus Thermoplasmatota archaeon]
MNFLGDLETGSKASRTNSPVAMITLLMLLTPLSGCLNNSEDISPSSGNQDLEEVLRINHIQMKGTHNSYHVEPLVSPTREYMYTHEELNVQASQLGVRQFEIDVWWDIRDGLRVYHNQYDSGTTCPTFENCMNTLLEWSNANPNHHTTFIWIEPKDWPEQSMDITTTVQMSGILDEIESEITQFWPRNKTITPADVQGNYPSLSDALANEGWPLIEDSRGKAIFVLLATGGMREIYLEDYFPIGRMFPMFTSQDDSPSYAQAIFSLTDPIGDGDEIERLAAEGYIVRTRADSGGEEADNNDTSRLEAALSSGAHSISTDYPAKVESIEYWVEIPGGTPSRCNPVSAPDQCSSENIEYVD